MFLKKRFNLENLQIINQKLVVRLTSKVAINKAFHYKF